MRLSGQPLLFMIRDEIIAYNQSHRCLGPRAKSLLIRTPIAVVEQLNSSPKHLDLFDTAAYDNTDTSEYVYLRIYPHYDTENDRLGEGGLRTTFNSTAFTYTTTRRGFKATVRDRRKLVLDLMRRLVDISETSSYNRYSPIKVIDFCHPELKYDTNTSAFGGESATIRWGAIALDASLPSLVRFQGEEYLSGDWGFTFKEVKLR